METIEDKSEQVEQKKDDNQNLDFFINKIDTGCIYGIRCNQAEDADRPILNALAEKQIDSACSSMVAWKLC